jgi:hypothetical protein
MSVRKCFVSFLITLSSSHIIYAQDSLKYSTLSLSIGLSTISNKDAFQSPYTYRGTNVLFNATYRKFRAKGQHIIDMTYSGGQIESIVSPSADNKLLLLNYDYLFNLQAKSINKRFIPSVGIGFHTLLSNTNYLPKVESPKSYLSGGAYLTLSGNILYQLNKRNSIRMQLGLPIFGLVYRPDFEINGKTLTKTSLIGKSCLFSFKLEYNYKLSANLNMTATYNYNYFIFDEPRPITILQNSLSIGLRKTF